MPLNAADWPLSAVLLQFPNAHDADATVWADVLGQARRAGFDRVDLIDSWVRPGDLTEARRDELLQVLREQGLTVPVIPVARKSVIDPDSGEANLAYDHRTIDAAAGLGAKVVCLGLHRPLTAAQQKAQWFWTVDGPKDSDDPEVRSLAVARLQELGRHAAEVGLLISLELYEDTYLGTAASAVRLVEEIGMPEVGLCPDVGNLIRLHRPVEHWRDLYAATLPYANYWQAKSYQRDEDPSTGAVFAIPAPLESGIVNHREVVAMAIGAGFQGSFGLEHYGGDGLSVCAANREYLRRILPETGDYAAGTSRVAQPVF
ncbi:sugar phosphate isomerase/epimerase [Pseudolysinimonas kribbensis]|uniref:Xylose isomerase n=1 Tax=Pseudolysinimonas kribbensis TaxID=433641 RepID=A0ABQ6K533_9MICO|nr:sugar phosphate isomerase/epimerase family protein [Pseudolysinimonas kribbensis]GMA94414.1 xylose isomerase [Pseudolysinimonas kribbensis]